VTGQVCITCGDVASEMQVVRIDRGRELALCEDPCGERHTVEIALVLPVAEGDTLLVHAGTAISNLGPVDRMDPAGGPGGADAGADGNRPSRRRGQGIQAGAEHPPGVVQ
jgi:hydrogenase maturation factor